MDSVGTDAVGAVVASADAMMPANAIAANTAKDIAVWREPTMVTVMELEKLQKELERDPVLMFKRSAR